LNPPTTERNSWLRQWQVDFQPVFFPNTEQEYTTQITMCFVLHFVHSGSIFLADFSVKFFTNVIFQKTPKLLLYNFVQSIIAKMGGAGGPAGRLGGGGGAMGRRRGAAAKAAGGRRAMGANL